MKRNISIILALAMCLGLLCGCGNKIEADTYVKDAIDAAYRCEITDDYLGISGQERQECQENYESGVTEKAEFMAMCLSIDLGACSDDILSDLTELMKEIYSHAKYEVGKVTRDGDNYFVDVTVYPLDIMQNCLPRMKEHYLKFVERVDAGEFKDKEAERDNIYAREAMDILRGAIDGMGYLEPETVQVEVVYDGSGAYFFRDAGKAEVDKLIIKY